MLQTRGPGPIPGKDASWPITGWGLAIPALKVIVIVQI